MIRRSIEDAQRQEQEHLTDAILRSNLKDPEQEVVVSRLTTCSQTVKSVLLTSAHLLDCINNVLKEGCETSPEGANGALLLVPLTSDMLQRTCHALQDFHVVHYRKDLSLIKQALSSIPKRQDRPKIKGERHAKILRHGTSSDVATAGSVSMPPSDDEVPVMQQHGGHHEDPESAPGSYEVIVENTFFTVRSMRGASSSSTARAWSAP